MQCCWLIWCDVLNALMTGYLNNIASTTSGYQCLGTIYLKFWFLFDNICGGTQGSTSLQQIEAENKSTMMNREQHSTDGKRSASQSPECIVLLWLKPSASTTSVNMQTEWEQAKEEGGGERVDGKGDNLKRRQETEGKKKIECIYASVHPSEQRK